MHTPSEFHIAVFTKPPVPGQVKTRLIPALSAEGAARLHHRLLLRTLAMAREACAANLSLWVAGDLNHPALQACSEHFGAPLRAQHGCDLGERMAAALDALLCSHTRVLLIGTDCPLLTSAHLRAAAARLDGRHDAALIPAEDGGYVLVGAAALPAVRRAVLFDALFRDIAWGTAAVMAQTRARLAERGLRWAELPALWDLDRPEDLPRLVALDLASIPEAEAR